MLPQVLTCSPLCLIRPTEMVRFAASVLLLAGLAPKRTSGGLAPPVSRRSCVWRRGLKWRGLTPSSGPSAYADSGAA